VKSPRVGLMTIGTEEGKGNALITETNDLLRRAGDIINYAGPIEGFHVFAEHVDVVVCDGFVGNIVLKFTEGMAEGLFQTIVSEINEADPDLLERLGPVMKKLHAEHDWREYGGAPLLGVAGYCLICHGRSDARAIKNAIRVGKQLHKSAINDKIVESVGKSIPSEQ